MQYKMVNNTKIIKKKIKTKLSTKLFKEKFTLKLYTWKETKINSNKKPDLNNKIVLNKKI